MTVDTAVRTQESVTVEDIDANFLFESWIECNGVRKNVLEALTQRVNSLIDPACNAQKAYKLARELLAKGEITAELYEPLESGYKRKAAEVVTAVNTKKFYEMQNEGAINAILEGWMEGTASLVRVQRRYGSRG